MTDLANSLSMQTAFGDEAIQSAENMLLTFTKVGKSAYLCTLPSHAIAGMKGTKEAIEGQRVVRRR